MMIPLCKPYIGDEEIAKITEVLKSNWLAHGPVNEKLEEEFAKYIGTKYAVSLNSCTSALQLAMLCKGLQGEIIVPSFTFIASANSIINALCEPVFADVDFETRNMDPSKVEEKITDKTVGIMPVHYGGQSCSMDQIMELAQKHDLTVIEDSAEAIGGEFEGKKVGSFGVGCFSFYPTKNMTTGEGGMITTNEYELVKKIKMYKAHGISTNTWQREHLKEPWIRDAVYPGFNYRLCDVLAAIGIVQMKKLEEMNEKRRAHARFLNEHLTSPGLQRPKEIGQAKHVYQMYTITLDIKIINRSEFVNYLRENGVGASVHFDPPCHLNTYYMKKYGYREGDFPVSEKLSKSIVTLPMYPGMTTEDLETIVSKVKDAIKHAKK